MFQALSERQGQAFLAQTAVFAMALFPSNPVDIELGIIAHLDAGASGTAGRLVATGRR